MTLKPFVINLQDLAFLLKQINFRPLFDGDGNAVVNWDGSSPIFDAQGVLLSDGAGDAAANIGLFGVGFPSVTAPIGVRDVTGFHNNLFGTQADWGAVDEIFRRDAGSDYTNYVVADPTGDYLNGNGGIGSYTLQSDYTTTVTGNTVNQQNVVDYTPRMISRTVTTAGVNLLTDANGHYVAWDAARYISDVDYAALIDASGVNTAQLVEGVKIVALETTEAQILGSSGQPLVWSVSNYQQSAVYASTLTTYGILSLGGLFGSATGGALVDGQPIYLQTAPGVYAQLSNFGIPVLYNQAAFEYKHLIDASGVDFGDLVDGEVITFVTGQTSGYGLLETLGHIDFQNPDSGEFFIGSENPGVAPVNSWFAIFGQFFDHGLDFIDKGGQGTTIKIALATDDPLYGALGPDGQPVTAITIARATVDTANDGDPNYINHTSPFIDQSQTYGSHEQVSMMLRKWESTDNGVSFHMGMELFDGQTLVDAWERKWPDGTTEMVHDTLPTLSELRDHVLDTSRDSLSWEDVLNLRNRDANGDLATGDAAGNSGHALLLDINPRFDAQRLDSLQAVGDSTVDALVDNAVSVLAANTPADFTFGRTDGTSGGIQLTVTGGAGGPHLPDGTYTGASALAPWLNFSNFSITAPDGPVHDAVGQILMASIGDHYIAGDGRVNENFGLTSIHHVFHEEHNYQVENLKTWIYAHDANNTPNDHAGLHEWQIDTGVQDGSGNFLNIDGSIAWDPNKMFEGTKLIVEMEYQHAAVDQYARTITPRIQEFVGYSSSVDSTISLEYAQVAFRFGHSTIRETLDTIDPSGWFKGAVTKYALEKAFLAPETFAEEGVAAITLGLSRQQMNEVDEFITPALNQGLLGQPLDLAAINIARGRDLGIPTLNDFRAALGMTEYTGWSDFGANMMHPESLVSFIAAYSFDGNVAKAQEMLDLADGVIASGSGANGWTAEQAIAFLNNGDTGDIALKAAALGFDKIDSWLGGLAEAHVPGGLLGETFDTVFVAQIQALMDGDRFYYLYRLFGTQIHEEVNNGQFKDIVERNTGLEHLNGSIFAYADKYYDFNDAAVVDSGDEHSYAAELAANAGANNGTGAGIFSDGGASTANNGSLITIDGRTYIRDVRPELDPTQVHTVEGTPTSGADSHEVIVGTDFVDYIQGRAGDDTLYGEGGDDILFGGGGVDRVYGGDGDDIIDTGEGPDLADGGAGKDIIYGRGSGSEVGGFDQLVGGSGNDIIIGGEGIDKLSGGSGDDIIYGDSPVTPAFGNTDPFTHGGDGNDYIDGGASGDNLYGNEGDDMVVGGADQDLIYGGLGDDILRPGNPSQAINGGPDEVVGDDGYINSGYDLIDFSDLVASANGLTIDMINQNNPLVAIDGTSPMPAWWQVEGIIGSQNNDTIVGDSAGDATAGVSLGGNWLIGGDGNDTIQGNGGNDIIVGGSIRLDTLIGTYADGLAGYADNTENAYTGASNRATGDLSGGLLAAAGMSDQAHFQEMLRSQMFRNKVLGNGGEDPGMTAMGPNWEPDGTPNADVGTDTAVFAGNVGDYSVVAYDVAGNEVANPVANIAQVFAVKITDTVGERTLEDGTILPSDGTDLVIGVEQFQFADGTVDLARIVQGATNTAPVITSPAAFAIEENTTAVGTIAVTDPDTQAAVDPQVLTFSIAGGIDAALFAIDAQTGALSFIAAPNFEAIVEGATNVYDVIVQVSDGLAQVTQQLAVSVNNVDEAATGTLNIVSVIDGGDRATLNALLALVDPDLVHPENVNGDVLSYQWQQLVNGIWQNSQADQPLVAENGGTFRVVATDTGPVGGDTLVISPETAVIGTLDDDNLAGTAGNDIIAGLDGVDTAVFAAPLSNNSFSLDGNGNLVVTGPEGTDTLMGIERVSFAGEAFNLVVGTNGNNQFGGSLSGQGVNVADLILGLDGNDTLNGNSGNDVLVGGLGTNQLNGGPGSDTAGYMGASSGVTVSLANTNFQNTVGAGFDRLNSIENLIGSSHADTLTGNNSNNTLIGGAGNDVLRGGGGNDTIIWNTGDGRDSVNGDTGTGDTFIVNGDGSTETFDIYAMTNGQNGGLAALLGTTFANSTEIVITRTVGTTTTVVAELDNIDEIVVNTLNVTANNNNGGLDAGVTAGDTVAVHGNFNNTDLNFSTITVNSHGGDLTVDVSERESGHRIHVVTDGGSANIIGPMVAADLVETNGGDIYHDGEIQTEEPVNQASTVSLANVVTTLPEGCSFPLKVADIIIDDDGIGENKLKLTGSDAHLFQIVAVGVAFELQMMAAAGALGAREDRTFNVNVEVDDESIGDSPEDSAAFSIDVPGRSQGGSHDGHHHHGQGEHEHAQQGEHSAEHDHTAYEGCDDDAEDDDGMVLNGTSRDDMLKGSSGDDRMSGGSGDDTLKGKSGDDNMSGGSGDDQMNGGSGDDKMSGGSGDDHIAGGSGDDELSGGSGDDTLLGGSGDDTLIGGSGDDILNGGIGDDVLNGGSGDDMFVFKQNFGNDTITTFQAGDTIDLSAFANVGFDSLDIFVDGNMADIAISGMDDTIHIDDTGGRELTQDDFAFA